MSNSKLYNVIGVMSGTSLDGIDMAYCQFKEKEDKLTYSLIDFKHIPYDELWQNRLANAHLLSAFDLLELDKSYGSYLGYQVAKWVRDNDFQPDLIASHGHTVFHQPEKGVTYQIGDGNSMCDACGFPLANDFRSKDVCLGGQGAPLVPIGDQMLFGDFDACINLGGIANISYEINQIRFAFDICSANMGLNEVSNLLGVAFDKDGMFAASGNVCIEMLKELNALSFFNEKPPKTLGREWYAYHIRPILNKYSISSVDQLATLCEHISNQIAHVCNEQNIKRVLFTGGGARNTHLMSRIKEQINANVIVPDSNIIDFKEAIVFALLGLLRLQNKVNCLSSVTGARQDHCSGQLHYPELSQKIKLEKEFSSLSE